MPPAGAGKKGGMNAFDESLAKLARPRNRSVYRRAGLFERLDEYRDSAATWVSAPAGSGKTTFASSYLQVKDCPSIWYHVDEGDRDIATLFWYLREAARRFAPRKSAALPTYTSAYQGSLAAFSNRFFEKLFGILPSGFIIVFDDCQQMNGEDHLYTALAQAITVMPSTGHLVMISRDVLPSQLCRFMANESLHVLDSHDMRLDSDELRAIARMRKPNISEEALENLEARADGWAAGLIFGLQDVGVDTEATRSQADAGRDVLFGYFASELYERQEVSARRTITQLALFPQMTQDMAVQLTGNERAGTLLNWLHRHNYFVSLEIHHTPVYRFHPLFREFLLHKLESESRADVLKALRRRAARLLEQHDLGGAALRLYRQCESWDEAARLITERARRQFTQGRLAGLEREINELPADVVTANPWLAYWQGMCRMFFRPTESHSCFLQSYQTFLEQKDYEGALTAWSGAINSELAEWGDVKVIDHWIDLGEELFANENLVRSELVGAQAVVSMCAGLFLCRPHSPSLEQFARKAHTILTIVQDRTFSLMGANLMLVFYAWQGKLPKARLMLESLNTRMAVDDLADHHAVMWLAARAWVELASGNAARCLELVEQGLQLGERTGVHMFDYRFFGMAAQAALLLGDGKSADEYLVRYQDVVPAHARLILFHVHYLSAWRHWNEGDAGAAREHLSLARGFLEAAGSPSIIMTKVTLAEAIIAFGTGDASEGRRKLDAAKAVANRVDSDWLKYHCALMEADLADREGERKRCLRYLREALLLANVQRLAVTEWWNPQRMARLMELALAQDIYPDCVRRIIETCGLRPGPMSADSEHWPWAVRIRLLGKFELEVHGEIIGADAKGQRKVLELLQCLIALGGGDVPASRIADALWPEADGDDARNALKTNIHRLRKLLGSHEAVVNRGGVLTLSPDICWTDVRAFTHLAQTPAGDPGRIRNLRQALQLYRGRLLEAEESSWVITPRARLQALEHEAVMELGARYESRCRWDKAIRIYRKGFDSDALDEEVARRLMSCYQQSGRDTEALAVYQQCCFELEQQVARQPSRETRSLADRIGNS